MLGETGRTGHICRKRKHTNSDVNTPNTVNTVWPFFCPKQLIVSAEETRIENLLHHCMCVCVCMCACVCVRERERERESECRQKQAVDSAVDRHFRHKHSPWVNYHPIHTTKTTQIMAHVIGSMWFLNRASFILL